MRQVYQYTTSNNHNSLAIRRITAEEDLQLQQLLDRRKAHEPIQYLMGQWDFLDHVFEVRPPLLCPRPETEELVLLVAASPCLNTSSEATSPVVRRILDVGAGTGCIGISLAARLPPAVRVTALDVEPQAVMTARANAKRILGSDNHARRRYQVQEIAAQDFQIPDDSHRFDLVVSNPPYVLTRDMETLDAVVSQWESHQALWGGDDGMDVIRAIIHQLPYWCRAGADCWMEVDPTHPALLQTWLTRQPKDGVVFVESRPDLFGMERFVHLRVTEEKSRCS